MTDLRKLIDCLNKEHVLEMLYLSEEIADLFAKREHLAEAFRKLPKEMNSVYASSCRAEQLLVAVGSVGELIAEAEMFPDEVNVEQEVENILLHIPSGVEERLCKAGIVDPPIEVPL